MSKVPKSLNVKFQITDIELELPKSSFEAAGSRVAIFVGRKGKDSLTRRTKWFTVSDPSELPTSTRQLATVEATSVTRHSSTGGEEGATITEQPAEMAVLKYGALNNVEYDIEMHPLNKFDGDWVFDAKLGHPLMVFAKVISKARPGVKGNAARSEQESNLNDMMDIDQEDVDDDFSGDEENLDAEGEDEESKLSVSGMKNMGLTAEQVAALTGEERCEDDVLVEQLKREITPLKRRYLAFPKLIDVADVVNTKAKSQVFSDRLKCKSAALLGSVLTFKITAVVPKDEMEKHDEKAKEKEDKEAKKRREKEEKLLEKERKKQEKANKKANKGADGGAYGVDVTNRDTEGGAVTHDDPNRNAQVQSTPEPAKKSRNPFSLIKEGVSSIFSSETKNQITPFPLKHKSSAFPYLVLLDGFKLRQLRMSAEYYRAIHLRLGNDSNSLETFPFLLLDASDAQFVKEEPYTHFDGSTKTRQYFDFGDNHVFLGHKHIRNVTGFDTLQALQAHEKHYWEVKEKEKNGEENVGEMQIDALQVQLLDVGEKFIPVAIEPTKYSANEAQGKDTKYTRVVASLIVPKSLTNVEIIDDEAEKKAYIQKLKKEQKEKLKAEKEAAKQREREEKMAAKQGEAAEDVATEGTGEERDGDHSAAGSAPEEAEEKKEEVAPEAEESEKKEEEEEGKEERVNFESEGADHVDPAEEGEGAAEEEPKVKEPIVSEASRIVANATRSFQLPLNILNEEYIPKDGINYVIKFKTGEEIHFRARRVLLPSVTPFGHLAGAFNEVTLNQFFDQEDEKKKNEKEES